MSEAILPRFPVKAMPGDAREARLVGLYEERRRGLWMQRIRALGGALAPQQWRGLAEAARRFTPGAPLHLTTRQDVELHDLTPETVPRAQATLADAGLTGLAACGDTPRNITVCPCSGALPGGVDLVPAAREIERLLGATPGAFSLPRKFKISLSACAEACGMPWINDLGLVAAKHNGQWGFEAVLAGSLGGVPKTGMRFLDWLPAEDLLPMVLAAVRVFAAHGDREHRGRARLRHVRERLGDAAFAGIVNEAFHAAKAERHWAAVPLPESGEGYGARLTLTFPNGDVIPDAAEALAVLAEEDGLSVRVALDHSVIVFGRNDDEAHRAVGRFEALSGAGRRQPSVVACPGTRWCSAALTDTNNLADRIRNELAAKLPDGATVRISGCPNGCAQSAVADIGLIGGLAGPAGAKREVYALYTGGGNGRSNRLGEVARRGLSAEQAILEISRLLDTGALRRGT